MTVQQVIDYLKSQGIVQLVDEELPRNPYFNADDDDPTPYTYDLKGRKGYKKAQRDMLLAGYRKVKEL